TRAHGWWQCPCANFVKILRYGPNRQRASDLASLFDHLVGDGEQRRRNFKAERLRRLEIDDDLEFGGQHDREFGWLGAFENAAGVNPSLLILTCYVRSIADEPARHCKLTKWIDCWHPNAGRQHNQFLASKQEKGIGADKKCIRALVSNS